MTCEAPALRDRPAPSSPAATQPAATQGPRRRPGARLPLRRLLTATSAACVLVLLTGSASPAGASTPGTRADAGAAASTLPATPRPAASLPATSLPATSLPDASGPATPAAVPPAVAQAQRAGLTVRPVSAPLAPARSDRLQQHAAGAGSGLRTALSWAALGLLVAGLLLAQASSDPGTRVRRS